MPTARPDDEIPQRPGEQRLNLLAGIAGVVILLALALLYAWLISNFGLPLAG